MDKKYKIGIVEYLNTKPLIHKIEKSNLANKAEFIYAYPSLLTKYFNDKIIDIALLPVANLKLSKLKTYIISDYCIGCLNEVASVGVVSNSKLNEINEIILDYQSTTSNELLKILMNKYWKKSINYIIQEDYNLNTLKNNQGALVIGDKAFKWKNRYLYYYDLGLYWNKFTNLPFVFAAWISNKEISKDFIFNFNEFQKNNLLNINEIIKLNKIENYTIEKYYTENISYFLDENKKKGLDLFLSML